jgi:hypothetical protein
MRSAERATDIAIDFAASCFENIFESWEPTLIRSEYEYSVPDEASINAIESGALLASSI